MHKTIMKFVCFFIIIFVVSFDQYSKYWIVEKIFQKNFFDDTMLTHLLYHHSLTICTHLNMVLVGNKGVSFSFLSANTVFQTSLLVGMAGIIVSLLCIALYRAQSRLFQAALACIIGGGVGNMIDRYRFQAVIDFIDVHYENWHFPAFNVADSFISVGVGLIIIHILFLKNNQKG